jgi:DNA processing protein
LARAGDWSDGGRRHTVTIDDPRYPALLKELADPPPVLFVRGAPACLDHDQIAVVGSRTATPVGLETARDFARALVECGWAVSSGLALGIDGAAHRGALDAGGLTVAVAGTGPDTVYPARHGGLLDAIVECGGCLVTELPPGSGPRREHFPRRNRILSGLGRGTLVVEAARRSGSLVTARLAAEQGREVFAMPGSIHNPLSRGCHALLRLGAKLVESVDDINEEFPWRPCPASATPASGSAVAVRSALDSAEMRLLGCMGDAPDSPDDLVRRSGLTAAAVSSILLKLELEGAVHAVAGGRFQRAPGGPAAQGHGARRPK